MKILDPLGLSLFWLVRMWSWVPRLGSIAPPVRLPVRTVPPRRDSDGPLPSSGVRRGPRGPQPPPVSAAASIAAVGRRADEAIGSLPAPRSLVRSGRRQLGRRWAHRVAFGSAPGRRVLGPGRYL